MKNWKVFEDNGGGLTLVVFEDGSEEKIYYLHTGYELFPEVLAECLDDLENGVDPESWGGNVFDRECPDDDRMMEIIAERGVDPRNIETWFPTEDNITGCDIIVDGRECYPERMGYNALDALKSVGKVRDYLIEIGGND